MKFADLDQALLEELATDPWIIVMIAYHACNVNDITPEWIDFELHGKSYCFYRPQKETK